MADDTTDTVREMETFADEGDVILVVGNEKQKMRVSSVILSMASPVFKALLGPHFREGQEPRSSSSPVEVPLSDDESESMRDILDILHFRSGRMTALYMDSETRSAGYLLRFAVTADKYDLAEPVRGHAKSMLQEWLAEYANCYLDDQQLFISIIIAAYVLDQESAFSSATHAFVRHGTYPISSCYTQAARDGGVDMGMIPASLPGQ